MNVFLNPVILLLIGLSIGILPLQKINRLVKNNSEEVLSSWQYILICGVVLVGFISTFNVVKSVLRVTPISAQISDILPLIHKMVVRFKEGEYPYTMITDFGYELFPTYLPAHWFPFVFFEKLGTDYRIGATIILFFILIFYFYQLIFSVLPFAKKVGFVLLCFISIISILLSDGMIVGVSVEQMIMGYYILLVTIIATQKNFFGRAFAILLCLLSRFSLLYWLPLYLVSIYLWEGRKVTRQLILSLCAGVSVFYILPFVLKNNYIFFYAQNAYTQAAVGEWSKNADSHLSNGLGLAIYFLTFLEGSILHKVQMIQLVSFVASISCVSLLTFFLIKYKKQSNKSIFQIASLKILLTVFYAFIQVPYPYLWLVPISISFMLIWTVSIAAQRQDF
jgi:hypothetical protein